MRLVTLAVLLLASGLMPDHAAVAQGFMQTNLVSDIPGRALHTDANLVNPWGIAPGASGVFWTANNGAGNSSLYDPDGTPRPLVVSIPGGLPTGVVATAATDSSFRIPGAGGLARAAFIFVTQNGTVAAWNPTANPTAAIQVDSVPNAHYTGAALGGTPADPQLYAANFGAGRIDVFNRDFAMLTLTGSFTDPGAPADYAPFNVANVAGHIVVAFAQRDPTTGDEVAGPGLGFVSVFDMNGQFLRRLATGGTLNAPWAVVQAPAGFGAFGGSVLVGNFGDGRINAFNAGTGAFQGTLADTLGNPIALSGLWGLHFGLAVSGAGVAQRLYFAAGIEEEAHGLMGYLSQATPVGGQACANNSKGIGYWRKLCGGPNPGHGLGTGNGKGSGSDEKPGHGDGKGPKPGEPSDSLTALFACVGSGASPNAFGNGGCFTAGCDLLQKVGRRTDREHAAQVLLTVRLNLCAGLVCRSTRITCADSARMLTVGGLADSLDMMLCNGGDGPALRSLTGLLACATDGDELGDDDQGEDGDGDGDRGAFVHGIGIRTIGATPAHLSSGPVQFAVSTTAPALVRLRIYDALGRLVAEPMSGTMVVGTLTVSWDHRDTHGAPVSPGTYFYRATGGQKSTSGRFVILR